MFPFTHVFIAQGETDFLSGTPPEDYVRKFADLIASLRQRGIAAPIFDAKGVAIAAIGARVSFPYREDTELERRLQVILQASEAASLHLGYTPVSIAHVT